MKGYLRYVMLVLAVMAAAPQVAAAGCGNDCQKTRAAQTAVTPCGNDCHKDGAGKAPASGCRVMFGSGILYDNGTAIVVSAPEGWVIDDRSGVPGGLHAVFYPKGSSWQDSDTVMYARIVHKDGCCSSTLDKVMQKEASLIAADRIEFTAEDGGIYKTGKGREAAVRIYGGGIQKAVAYLDEGKAVAELVVSSRTVEGLKEAMPAFREFVGTYLFVSDDTAAGGGCKDGPTGTIVKREVEGEVGSVDKAGGVITFRPDGAGSDVAVHADDSLSSGIKTGDRIRVAYTEGEKNTATKLIKLHKIAMMPKACILSH